MDSAGVSLPPELLELGTVLDTNITAFARGSNDAQQLALRATKCVFEDSLHSEVKSIPHITKLFASLSPSEAPKTRGQMRKKRKRSPSPPPLMKPSLTPLQSLIIDGMDETQLWAQLDLKLKTVCDMLDLVVEVDNDMDTEKGVEQTQDTLSMDNADSLDLDDMHEAEHFSEDSEEEEFGSSVSSQGEESITDLQDSSDEGDEDETEDNPWAPMRRGLIAPGTQPSTLNDDFFDLATFNAETEQAEANHSSRGQLAEEDESDQDIDLFMPIDSADNVHDESENGTYYYNDFFSASQDGLRSKAKNKAGGERNGKVRFHEEVRVKKIRQRGKGLPLHALEADDEEYADLDGDGSWLGLGEMDGEDGDEFDSQIDNGDDDFVANETEEIQSTTVERLKQDLFAEEEEAPQPDLSTHEKRMIVLQRQIQDLESENVASKDWALMGEATSRSRPRNSLLEEDLEFDRMVKATPIVTVESVKALEDRIKARILEGVFDDVVRIRSSDDKPFAPSRFAQLQDTKSTQSLAQIYEEDYVNKSTGNMPTSSRDAKLLKEHGEIEHAWESICSKLDALCNAHFTPKQPKTVISTTSNTSSAVLESALPTTKSVVSALAPEEIFAASSSEPRARSEMMPNEKKSLRNKLRKARQRSRDELQQSVGKPTKAKQIKSIGKQKAAALASIVKVGKGVTVVGKKKSTTNRGRNS